MDFKSIIEMIEEQKRDEQLSTKLYRYTGLIQAIEFFSHRLNLEQIVDAAFDFINELLTLEKSAAFVMQDNGYVLKKLKGYDSGMIVPVNGKDLQNLAMLHGTILYDRSGLEKYFGAAILDDYGITAVTPLIIESSLYGFILMSRKTAGEMNQDDYIISEALMRLINNALGSYKRYEDLQRSNRELDEKVFNLFAINQSSKVLLSELNLDVLNPLSIDVFSELTQSSVTGFVLYDEKGERFILKAYKDVLFSEPKEDIFLTRGMLSRVDMNRVIIDVSDERDILYFNSIFKEGIDAIKTLKPLYVVLLIKNGRILGFVSLGKTITGKQYKSSVFELIESLASATYIALSNAQLFRQVNEQKRVIQGKLKKLVSLNNLIKNINSALKVNTLLDLAVKTLQASFDMEMGLIALFNNEKKVFEITNTVGINPDKKIIEPNSNWKRIFDGEVIMDARNEAASDYFDLSFCRKISENAGVFIVPLFLESMGVELLGVLVVFKYGKVPLNDEENRLMIETVGGHIAPVMSHLITIEEQKKFLLHNCVEVFKKDLKKEISGAVETSACLEIIRINNNSDFMFRANNMIDKLKSVYRKVYPFTNNNIFIIINGNEDSADESLIHLIELESMEVERYTLGVEFKNYQEFFKLF